MVCLGCQGECDAVGLPVAHAPNHPRDSELTVPACDPDSWAACWEMSCSVVCHSSLLMSESALKATGMRAEAHCRRACSL